MLKKIFVSAVLLLAVLSFVVSLLKGNNNSDPTVEIGDRVAVIDIQGPIMSGDSSDSLWNQAQGVTSGEIMRQIRDAAADDSVKALVLRIDSGGGSATAAEEVSRELLRFKADTHKPIVATMGDMGASAAYWIAACASDKIYANSTTITGSIGVYMPYMNTEELFKKIGISSGKIKSGTYKDIMSSDREMTPEERLILQTMVDEIYSQFITVVAEGRKMEPGIVRTYADGRIYTGAQAQRIGLVDELGNYYDALAAAGELAGIDGMPQVKSKAKAQPWEILLGAKLAHAVKTEFIQEFTSSLQGGSPRAER